MCLRVERFSSPIVNTAVIKIEEALAQSNEDANIIEGNSGLQKLKRLEAEGSISNISFMPDESTKMLVFEFFFELGNRGKYEDFNC